MRFRSKDEAEAVRRNRVSGAETYEAALRAYEATMAERQAILAEEPGADLGPEPRLPDRPAFDEAEIFGARLLGDDDQPELVQTRFGEVMAMPGHYIFVSERDSAHTFVVHPSDVQNSNIWEPVND